MKKTHAGLAPSHSTAALKSSYDSRKENITDTSGGGSVGRTGASQSTLGGGEGKSQSNYKSNDRDTDKKVLNILTEGDIKRVK